MRIIVYSTFTEVAPYVDIVQEAADHFKDALGFLPQSVYREAAEQGKLFVATIPDGDTQKFVGHLLYGGTYPHCRLFQLFVDPNFQNHNIGRELLARLVKQCEANNYLTIRARVACDLAANKFWDRVGFAIFKTEPGGATRNRFINVRVRHLDTPNLFSPVVAFDNDLGIVERFAPRNPVYAIDLNVFFDSVKRRRNEEEANAIIGAALKNLVRMAVTKEFIVELERNSTSPDPLLNFAQQLPQLLPPPPSELDSLAKELATLVFPDQLRNNHISTQDWSDLRHLAIAIHNQAAGFITREKAILRVRQDLLSKYGIDLVGPQEFSESMDFGISGEAPSIAVEAAGTSVTIKDLRSVEVALATRFLKGFGIAEHLIEDATAQTASRRCIVAVDSQTQVFGFAAWDTTTSVTGITEAFICIDETNPLAPSLSDASIIAICSDATANAPALIRLRLSGSSVTTQTTAVTHGFRVSARAEGELKLEKISIGRAIMPGNWAMIRHRVRMLSGIELPEAIPSHRTENCILSIKNPSGQALKVRLREFEDLVGPTLLACPGRDGLIVPIRQSYSEFLLQTSNQLSLLSSPESILLRERVYYNTERAANMFEENAPILFYESQAGGGQGAVVAIARICRTELIQKAELTEDMEKRGVVNRDGLEDLTVHSRVSATSFDNLLKFRNPVRLQTLKSLKCCPPNNLVTASKLTSDQILSILGETETYV